mgnify:CR=1 FL=1
MKTIILLLRAIQVSANTELRGHILSGYKENMKMMKTVFLILFLSMTSYANASFSGTFFCSDSEYVSIEFSEEHTEVATIEYLEKKRILKIKDAILFNFEIDKYFEIKMFTDSKLIVQTFSLSDDVLTIRLRDKDISCERVIVSNIR